mgnify:CR=1 FL=1
MLISVFSKEAIAMEFDGFGERWLWRQDTDPEGDQEPPPASAENHHLGIVQWAERRGCVLSREKRMGGERR